ncbi:baseplate J/gp47 family protein [Enhygromyxa salina]|uniref:baseplate J/gp47 family protein n=1 Tax=Enhygromyxa salina TaxID=215803 RepID=UPI0011BABCCB|nr:baseplate J/gp47 family protein [Enhygromyxa salina]
MTIAAASVIGYQNPVSLIRVWFDARKAGTIERIPTRTVTANHLLNIPSPVTLSPDSSLPAADTNIIIQDAEGNAVPAKGGGSTLNDTPHITITKILDTQFQGELVKPITFLWGLTKVTRGETVNREIIGSGNAAQPWQSLQLARSPLTYLADPFAPGGRKPELEVYVNGLKWTRALSFYGATPTDEIYVIRHDADHNTHIQFGDGELGKRLPTGTNNVVATYRFGTGGNVEANAINKLVRPIPGVKSVSNPLPATGGEDPPTPAQAREQAIQSLRVLGHLVSLADFEVEAARYGGVVQARARWAWDADGEDALVKVWIVCEGFADPSPDLRTYLQNMAEPGARVEVVKALPLYRYLNLDLELDPSYIPQDVQAAVHATLYDERDGLLVPRNAVIGGAFHRSELYAAIHSVQGVLAVRGASVDYSPMGKTVSAPEGYYLAFTDSPPV